MTDMLVRLYDCKESNRPFRKDLSIHRAMSIDAAAIVDFVEQEFSEICAEWVDETKACLYRQPTTCFVAMEDKSIIGFACYDASAKGMLGPIGVARSHRHRGTASDLLQHCFSAMRNDGYAYAVIGWVSSEEFYEKSCGAVAIDNSFPGVYSRMRVHN